MNNQQKQFVVRLNCTELIQSKILAYQILKQSYINKQETNIISLKIMKGKTEIQFNQRNPKFSTPYFQIKQNSCNKYDGSYLKDGFGQLEWPDGRSYKGEWQNNKQHRVGIYVGYNGIEKEGEWVEGKLIRWNKSKARLSII